MSRYIIYATGQLFQNNIEKICWENIVAVSDKKADLGKTINGVPYILPQSICSVKYDYIAIFSDKYFEEIKMELNGHYFIPNEKIVSWKAVVGDDEDKRMVLDFLNSYVEEKKIKKMLDLDMALLPQYSFEHKNDGVSVDAIGIPKFPIYYSIYENVFGDICECDQMYDVAFGIYKKQDRHLAEVLSKTSNILFYFSYDKLEDLKSIKWEQFKCVKRYSLSDGIVVEISNRERVQSKDLQIYVVMHKEYNVISNEVYKPLCVGNSYYNADYLSEHIGDNISYLNEKINECTALYWIWRNTDSKYVGLNHYRRYFYNDSIVNNGNYLTGERAEKLLKEYDIILPQLFPLYSTTVLNHIRGSIDSSLCDKALEIFREVIAKNQPQYVEVFEEVMNGRIEYLCNMFVTRREVLNNYCEWLFSFLIEAANKISVEGYEAYDKRVMGFFAERMWTVWLMNQKLKIKELPFVIVK